MKFSKEIEKFIGIFLKEIEENNAAIFAGAGLSVASGHVDWKELLSEFAEDLDLDINRETDLLSLTQYHLNKNANNRHQLTQKVLDEFHHGKQPNPNHHILARLPFSTYWTTNYDRLIEKALEKASKVVDVKYTEPKLSQTVRGRDAVVYKMHGDVEQPQDVILSKDQYERYYQTHGAFINALAGDLVTKTFLFIGFGFTDPNLDFILSRIRSTFKDHQRRHFCFFREIKRDKDDCDKDFEQKQVKQRLVIEDLKRFNIHVLLVKEYEEITDILREIESRYNQKTVFISGSAHEYGSWATNDAEKFVSDLSKEIVRNGYKIVSGFGLGIGSYVINGVLEEVYMQKKEKLKDQLLLRPFPQGDLGKQQWESYRKDMVSYAGIAVFLFGNKLENGKVVLADGVRKEFEIAYNQGAFLIPVGATGYISKELWQEVLVDFTKYFPSGEHKDAFEQLGDESLSPEALISAVIKFLRLIVK